MAERCNRDCFNCPYEDCILEESDITLAERVALQEMERDFVLPKSRKEKEIAAYQKAYYEANREKIAACQRGKSKKHKQARDTAARKREEIMHGGVYVAR